MCDDGNRGKLMTMTKKKKKKSWSERKTSYSLFVVSERFVGLKAAH